MSDLLANASSVLLAGGCSMKDNAQGAGKRCRHRAEAY